MRVRVDASEWPLVRITCSTAIKPSDVERMSRQLQELLESRGPMVLLCDIDALQPGDVTPLLRWTLAQEADKLAARGAFMAEAIIIRNPLLRGLYSLYTWARRKHDYPSQTFGDVALATPWVMSHVPGRVQLTP